MSTHSQSQSEPTVHCIWMDAGIAGYKLCDRDLQCDKCPFDEIMRRPLLEAEARTPERGSSQGRPKRSSHAADAERALHSLFSSIDLSAFPDDRMFHRGHVWMQRVDDSTVTLGIDHVAASILGSVASVVLPQEGSRLVQKAPWCWLIHHEGALSLHSPLHGTVMETNNNLLERPERAILDPYRSGWIIRARYASARDAEDGFVDRRDYWPIVQIELRNMRTRFAQHLKRAPSVGPTMMDGGRGIETLSSMTGGPAYLAIIASMFAP